MNLGLETWIVLAVVLVTIVWALRGIWRSVRHRKICSTCGTAEDCPLAQGNPPLQDLESRPDKPQP